MSQLSIVDPKPNDLKQQARCYYLSWFGYWLDSATLDFSVMTVTWWLDFAKSPRLPHVSGVLSWLSARTSAGSAGWSPYTRPLFVIRVSSESGGWVPRRNIPREPWENCAVFYDLPLKVVLHYFRCFHKHVRFKGREWTSHTSVEGRGGSITLSNKGWKILSWKTKFAIVTWDVSERRQWSAVLVNSSFFTMAQAISTFFIKTEKYVIWSHNYNIGIM